MHSASVAGNAVIELFQSVSTAEQLNRWVLTFSLSHNHRVVKIFAHLARIEGSKTPFTADTCSRRISLARSQTILVHTRSHSRFGSTSTRSTFVGFRMRFLDSEAVIWTHLRRS